ncbi:IS110 family transposase [Streptomyces galbus]|uniref:IS110 family transposase n=1 Tax=Streptomyces gottesmaniae TaxID=3075518 RepID=UPI00052E66A8
MGQWTSTTRCRPLIGLPPSHDPPTVYLTDPGVHQASAAYRGQGKTDAKGAFVIADQARMRRDLGLLRLGDETAVDLKILARRRTDLHDTRWKTSTIPSPWFLPDPMLATPTCIRPLPPDHGAEPKWDGYRALVGR